MWKSGRESEREMSSKFHLKSPYSKCDNKQKVHIEIHLFVNRCTDVTTGISTVDSSDEVNAACEKENIYKALLV